MYFQIDVENVFSISTPSPLKMGAKLGNIKAQKGSTIGFLDSRDLGQKGPKRAKIGFLDFCAKLNH